MEYLAEYGETATFASHVPVLVLTEEDPSVNVLMKCISPSGLRRIVYAGDIVLPKARFFPLPVSKEACSRISGLLYRRISSSGMASIFTVSQEKLLKLCIFEDIRVVDLSALIVRLDAENDIVDERLLVLLYRLCR